MSDRSRDERETARIERERRRLSGEIEVPLGTVSASRPQATPPERGPRLRRRLGLRWLLLACAVLLVGVLGFFWLSIFTPFKGDGSGVVSVRIPQGAGAREVGDVLASRGVVSSGFFFSLRAAIAGEKGNLRSGRYTLRRGMSNGAALAVLTAAPQQEQAKVLRITLPEGPGRREIAPKVKAAGVQGSYLEASRRSGTLNPRDYGAPRGTRSLEGFLFPATYELPLPATSARLVTDQLTAFQDRFGKLDLSYAKSKNLSAYDVVIIASMIERETALAKERRRVASVIYNRLRDRIALGIDATTRYGYDNWTRPLLASELAGDNPYNTRSRLGLPPTPIGNPGLASLKAAANPERTGFLFYVVKPCGNGAHAFSKTDAEFQRDVAAYNSKRAALGGKDPSTCPKR
ncbi:unannotated protein [freshwater metagenome]|uniref:Unannotated protein n=1 Tax=freshwater metagenome TaxID=449393 RepID=A0A6J7ECS1_9ZZZZ|nr:endolytic transglycosylase MltG [Actinomycetota bacterium]